MLNRMVSALIFLLITVSLNAAAFSVNETVDNYRISFEADDVNLIATLKAWGIASVDFDDSNFKVITDNFDAAKGLVVLALSEKENSSQNVGSAVIVSILNESINTTYAETKLVENLHDNYVRIYDRTIDGHKGIYSLRGDGPDDPYLDRFGLYWLDESKDGFASRLVFVTGKGPESSMMTVLNTVHVEKI